MFKLHNTHFIDLKWKLFFLFFSLFFFFFYFLRNDNAYGHDFSIIILSNLTPDLDHGKMFYTNNIYYNTMELGCNERSHNKQKISLFHSCCHSRFKKNWMERGRERGYFLALPGIFITYVHWSIHIAFSRPNGIHSFTAVCMHFVINVFIGSMSWPSEFFCYYMYFTSDNQFRVIPRLWFSFCIWNM